MKIKEKTLLQKAKSIPIRIKQTAIVDKATKQEIELAIGWATNEITLSQLTKAFWGENTNTSKGIGGKALYYIACWLKAGIKRGIIKI